MKYHWSHGYCIALYNELSNILSKLIPCLCLHKYLYCKLVIILLTYVYHHSANFRLSSSHSWIKWIKKQNWLLFVVINQVYIYSLGFCSPDPDSCYSWTAIFETESKMINYSASNNMWNNVDFNAIHFWFLDQYYM